ncbi:hypothetical protein FZ103_15785 [Streptomonospora sp. PA3]|uniref:hypothetical protein n=1 Tax=Streptomonospora sp. PA3 TaxID=2607326 RepID=UPI0012DBF712|nr:hypothetical protein [Streptomonospora sp. PA3]MUL42614.1 hypothetical protein [Streptomonospora sp. PA3]
MSMINPENWGLSPKRKVTGSRKGRPVVRISLKRTKPSASPRSATGGCWPSPWGKGIWNNPMGE